MLPLIFFDDTIRKVISSGSSILQAIGCFSPGPEIQTPPIPYVQASYFPKKSGSHQINMVITRTK